MTEDQRIGTPTVTARRGRGGRRGVAGSLRGGPRTRTWPPQGPQAWRGMRRHFLGKFLVFLVFVVVAIAGLSALIGGFFFRGDGHRGPFFPIGIVVVVVVVLLVVRAGRRFASPVVDVMEAADRVAAGDYETRVEERGPREVQRLGRLVQRDDGAARLERGPAPATARRRRARAPDTALRDPGEPRGADRRRPSHRRGAPGVGPRRDQGDVAAAERPADALDRRGGRAHAASRADRSRTI